MDITERLVRLGQANPRWPRSAGTYFSHSSGKVSLGAVEKFFDETTALTEEASREIKHLRAVIADAGLVVP